MRKLFLSLSLLVVALTAAAWENPTTNVPDGYYEDRFVLPLKISVDGVDATALPAPIEMQVAAYIDGTLRAVVTEESSYDREPGAIPLMVRQLDIYGTKEEAGKEVTIKVMYNSLAYVFKQTFTYDYKTNPVTALTLTPLDSVALSDITINGTLPVADYDLKQHVSLIYGYYDPNDLDETTQAPKFKEVAEPQATLDQTETPLVLTWDYANLMDYIASIEDDKLTTTTLSTPEEGILLGLTASYAPNDLAGAPGDPAFLSQTQATVKIEQAYVAVTSISLVMNEKPVSALNAKVGDSFLTLIRPVTVIWNPETATDQTAVWILTKIGDEEQDPAVPVGAGADYTFESEGVYTFICTNSAEEATATLTVTVSEPVVFTPASDITLSLLEDKVYQLDADHVGELLHFTSGASHFDASKLSFEPEGEMENTDAPFTAKLEGTTLTLRGKYVGRHAFTVSYDGEPMQEMGDAGPVTSYLEVPVEVALSDGWNWTSVFGVAGESYALKPNGTIVDQIKDAEGAKKIIEIRSQDKILFNDPTYGFFGDLVELTPSDGMYKMKSNGARTLNFGCPDPRNPYISLSLPVGYTWIINPYEFSMTLDELNTALVGLSVNEGDKIFGKDQFCEFSAEDEKWVSTEGFTFEAGKGYIYLNTGTEALNARFSFTDIPECYKPKDAAQGIRGKNSIRPWEVQSARFADNMPIVATIEGLRNPENYLIGAFVGDECRGMGSWAVRDLMFINVAGVAGETVTFRLYNKFTGEFSPIGEAVTYAGRAGSMKAPVRLTAPAATGVRGMKVADAEDGTIYNLAGQKLTAPRKGIHIVGGRKVVF